MRGPRGEVLCRLHGDLAESLSMPARLTGSFCNGAFPPPARCRYLLPALRVSRRDPERDGRGDLSGDRADDGFGQAHCRRQKCAAGHPVATMVPDAPRGTLSVGLITELVT